MTHPIPGFRPGVEPEIVHMQHSIAAPRVAVVSLDVLHMMQESLEDSVGSGYSGVDIVSNQIHRLIQEASRE